jgi:hypothetical protein
MQWPCRIGRPAARAPRLGVWGRRRRPPGSDVWNGRDAARLAKLLDVPARRGAFDLPSSSMARARSPLLPRRLGRATRGKERGR